MTTEPTPEALAEAAKILRHNARCSRSPRYLAMGEHLEDCPASFVPAVALALVVKDEEIRRLRNALRMRSIVQHVRMAQGGASVPNGKSCGLCGWSWPEDGPERHTPDCLAALQQGEPT